MRAVYMAAPYNFLPPEKYGEWQDIRITFNPIEMF
jgi:hypothetical protein